MISGISVALQGEAAAARVPLDEAGRSLAEIERLSPVVQSIVLGLQARACSGQEQVLRSELTRLIAMAREADTFGLLPFPLTVSADLAFRTGTGKPPRATPKPSASRRSTGRGHPPSR